MVNDNNNGIVYTDLRFSKNKMCKALIELNEYALGSEFILPDEDLDITNIEEIIKNESKTGETAINLRYKNKDIIERLNKKFPEGCGYSKEEWPICENHIYLAWEKIAGQFSLEGKEHELGKKGWILHRLGKPLCSGQYLNVIEDEKRYDDCDCPVKAVCKDILDILKKYAYKN